MTDPRPRPKYGEYAPLPPAAPEHVSAASDAAAQASAVPVVSQSGVAHPASPAQPVSAQPVFANTAQGAVAPERKRRMWDVLLTSTLLFFGVVDVINSFSTVSNLGPILREGLAAQGVDSFTSDAVAAEAGGIANIVRVVVLVLTIIFALVQIQRRRIAFWIPLAGGIVAGAALLVAILVAVMGDPGFIAYVESMQ